MSMMNSREYDETKKRRQSIEKKQKEYNGKARSAPCKLSFANRSETRQQSWSYINDEVMRIRKSGGPLSKNRSCTYFEASSFACQSFFESVFGFCRAKTHLKYLHRSLWNVNTWRLSGKAGVFFPGWLRKQTHGSGLCPADTSLGRTS